MPTMAMRGLEWDAHPRVATATDVGQGDAILAALPNIDHKFSVTRLSKLLCLGLHGLHS